MIYRWSEVLQPEKFEPMWSVEFAPRRRWLLSCVGTFSRSWRPWRFWSRLRMSRDVKWRRLIAYAALLLIVCILVPYVVVQSSAVAFIYRVEQRNLVSILERVKKTPRPTTLPEWSYRGQGLTEQEMQAELERIQLQWDRMQAWAATEPTMSHATWFYVGEALFFPTRAQSAVTLPSVMGARPLIAPSEAVMTILGELINTDSLDMLRWNAARAFGFGGCLFLLLPATFVLLPASRRRAKVRWRHIGRVGLYGLFIPIAAPWMGIIALALTQFDADLPELAARLLVWFFMPLALIAWWTAAICRYLRMPHGAWIAFIMTVMSLLLVLAATYLVWPDEVGRWIQYLSDLYF